VIVTFTDSALLGSGVFLEEKQKSDREEDNEI
jgi:hypothetical protein